MAERKDTRTPENDEPKGGRPGPIDRGGHGGMATREVDTDSDPACTPEESKD
ncbi:hypothetical protein ACWIGI_34435 [Nocardia sp. NPDC055321]